MKKALALGSLLLVLSCAQKPVERPVVIEKPIIVEKPVYIKPKLPPLPERPTLEPVEFFHVGDMVCTTREGAKALLRNLYRLDAYARKLEDILLLLKDEGLDNGSRIPNRSEDGSGSVQGKTELPSSRNRNTR